MSLDDYFITPEEYLMEFTVKSDPKKVYHSEKRRLNTVKAKILQLLKDGQWHTNRELKQISHRFSARIKELRDEGWQIEREYWGEGVWAYRLVGRARP